MRFRERDTYLATATTDARLRPWPLILTGALDLERLAAATKSSQWVRSVAVKLWPSAITAYESGNESS